MATTTIKADDIPLDKIDAVIERLQAERDARINASVEAGEAIKVNVDVVGDEDVEMAKQRSLRDYHVPPGVPVHFNIIRYRYPEFCSDGVTPNPLNGPSPERVGEDFDLVEQSVAIVTSIPRYGLLALQAARAAGIDCR